MITYKKLIGKGVTDSNGIASITYTPTELSQITLIAENTAHNVADTESYNVKPPIFISVDKDIISRSETVEIYATRLPVSSGHTIHFYEKLEPVINVSSDKSIVQTNDNLELYAKVKDEDGSIATGVKVHFYEKEED